MRVLLVVCLGVVAIASLGQVNERSLDQEKWRDLTEDLNYREDSSTTQPVSHGPRGTQISSGFVKYLLIALVIAALVFLILRFATPGLFKPRKERSKVPAETRTIESFDRDELNDALGTALRAGDFRLAVRIYYLIIIRELAAKRLIRWHIEKTNNQYLAEMTNPTLMPGFMGSTRSYERVWFGEEPMNQQRYDILVTDFKQFIDQIRRK